MGGTGVTGEGEYCPNSPSAFSPPALLSDLKQAAKYPLVFVLIMINNIIAYQGLQNVYTLFINAHKQT